MLRPGPRRAVGVLLAATLVAILGLTSTGPLLAQTAASAETPGSGASYRVDGVRDGVFEGEPVRLVDLTLTNKGPHSTRPGGEVSVRWQGRDRGESVYVRRRDLTPFSKYDYFKPGQSYAATYVIPARADVGGVEIEDHYAPKGAHMRSWSWTEMAASGQR